MRDKKKIARNFFFVINKNSQLFCQENPYLKVKPYFIHVFFGCMLSLHQKFHWNIFCCKSLPSAVDNKSTF